MRTLAADFLRSSLLERRSLAEISVRNGVVRDSRLRTGRLYRRLDGDADSTHLSFVEFEHRAPTERLRLLKKTAIVEQQRVLGFGRPKLERLVPKQVTRRRLDHHAAIADGVRLVCVGG